MILPMLRVEGYYNLVIILYMVQKVIKIGSSAGVTIPKKQLDELGIRIGDDVNIAIKRVSKHDKHAKLMSEYAAFVKQYGQTLKNLSDR